MIQVELIALLRRLADNCNLMRLQDGTVRVLAYLESDVVGDVVPDGLFRAALPYVEGIWSPVDTERYRLNNRGRALIDAVTETV